MYRRLILSGGDPSAVNAGAGKAGVTWVRIKSGSFMMGSKDGEDYEKPVHRVRVKKEAEDYQVLLSHERAR